MLEIFIVLIIFTILYVKYTFGHWKRYGVQTLPPKFPFGNITEVALGRKNFGHLFKEMYYIMKAKGEKFAGAYMFLSPIFVPIHPEVIKNVVQSDFPHFGDRGFYVDEEGDPLSGNLFATGITKWRILRPKLAPTFTAGKMKAMFQTILKCGHGLKSVIDEHIQEKQPVDIKDVIARFNTDIIGSCAFGIECNSLKNPKAEFRIYGDKTFEPKASALLTLLLPHSILRKFGFRLFDYSIENFFRNIVTDIVTYRENNNVYRNDFMHLLLQLKNQGYLTDGKKFKAEGGEVCESNLTLSELTAQCFVFFVAGYETSSTATTFALFELALNQDIQEKVREEFKTVLKKYDGEITYEALMEMSYMDKVVYETLRKYPPVPILTRSCTKEYNLPNTSVVIKKNIMIVIPIIGLHHDPEYYPEPDKFDPDRFSEENKKKRPAYTWLPFGDGPRTCLAMRFGMLQVKLAILMLLRDFRITVSSKTKMPIELVPTSFLANVIGGMWIDVEKLEDN